MKDMFLCLLLNLGKFGDVTRASLSKDFSEIKLENEHGEYTIAIMRKDKDLEDKKNA